MTMALPKNGNQSTITTLDNAHQGPKQTQGMRPTGDPKSQSNRAHYNKKTENLPKSPQIVVENPSYWMTRESNTTMQAADGQNKRGRASPSCEASKKAKDASATMDTDENFDHLLLDPGMVSTELNMSKYDITDRIREPEGSEEDVENVQKAFVSAAGRGSMLEKLHEMGRMAAKVVRHQKTPTAAEESIVLKNGLTAEEWL